MKYKETHPQVILVAILLLSAVQIAYACGICNTMMLLYIIPIFIPFFTLSLMYGVITSFIVKSTWLGVKIALVWFVCLLLTTTLPSGPIPIIISILYSFLAPHNHLRKLLKKDKITEEKSNTVKAILYKLQIVTLLIAVLFGVGWQIYAPTYFDNNLIRMLRTHGYPTVRRASDRLMSIKDPEKQSQYIPELTRLLEGKNESRWIQKEIYRILAVWKNPDATQAIARIFDNMKYTDYEIASTATEAAKTLTALDKKSAAALIPPKIAEIKANSNELGGHYYMLLGTFVECIVNTNDTTAMVLVLTDENMEVVITSTQSTNTGDPARAALKALGAPLYGQDSEAYRRWWENEGKRKFDLPR